MYKLTKFVYETNPDTKFIERKYIVVRENISWDEAKTERKNDRSLVISKM